MLHYPGRRGKNGCDRLANWIKSRGMMKVAHLFSSFRGLGGVESVLKHHHSHDAQWGIVSDFIIYFEAEIEPLERVHFLGFNSRTTIREARQHLAATIARARPEVAVYHGTWGMPYLSDLDQALRRVLVLHGKSAGIDQSLDFRRQWLDGVICVSEETQEIARRTLPSLALERARRLPSPVSSCPVQISRLAFGGRPLILGYCGRLTRTHKRVERLPELCRALDQTNVDYRFEILGDGSERNWLERAFKNNPRIEFHGRKSGHDYWRVLSRWDAIVFVSDTEGLPLSLLEALSVGVIPIYPQIGSGGDVYVKQVALELLYQPGDLSHASQVIDRLSQLPSGQMEAWRNRGRTAVAPHLNDAYLAQFSAFLRFLLEAPRVSQDCFPRRPPLLDHLPFAMLGRIGAWRRWFLRQTSRPS